VKRKGRNVARLGEDRNRRGSDSPHCAISCQALFKIPPPTNFSAKRWHVTNKYGCDHSRKIFLRILFARRYMLARNSTATSANDIPRLEPLFANLPNLLRRRENLVRFLHGTVHFTLVAVHERMAWQGNSPISRISCPNGRDSNVIMVADLLDANPKHGEFK
jgi:hypothetical protein